ncbi:multi antimicrobial extrusion family drug/sodium antiporter [Halogeometricum pallidum JCM 14848]|uniref:Multi antimicrobial extrusion family drug/sodium antiporter n=1 Tax=Halogeometricum pallidum JCM 14848 TaxID=1227487 RepID=M0DBA9_HALPD|nr:MATE family efflux transporter [Halogeometricum pallidum]ELZ32012.1 multi antimicrobial extrusion family drug/sodium antiporter [Halogeometricum pallidum JCM 14848]
MEQLPPTEFDFGASAVTVWFARPIVGLFITGPGATPIIEHGAAFLRIVAPTWVIMASYHMMNGAFYGSGSTHMAMGIGVTTLWGVRALTVVLLILVFSFGAAGAWYAIALSNVTAAIAGAIFFFHGRWLQDVLADESVEETARDVDSGAYD